MMTSPMTSMVRTVAVVALALGMAAGAWAQTAKPRPNPRPNPRPAARPASPPPEQVLPGRLLVSVDDDAMVAIDGQPPVRFTAGEVKTIPVTLGKHLVHVVSVRAQALEQQQVVEIAEPGQQVVQFAIRGQVSIVTSLMQRRNASTAERGAMVLVVVDPALAAATATLAPSLVPLRVWLQSATGEAIGPRAPATPPLLHVELTQRSEGPAGPGGAKDMFACPVTVELAVFRGGVPATYSFPGTGAAFSEGQACINGRQRAVTSAMNALTAMVRKELR